MWINAEFSTATRFSKPFNPRFTRISVSVGIKLPRTANEKTSRRLQGRPFFLVRIEARPQPADGLFFHKGFIHNLHRILRRMIP